MRTRLAGIQPGYLPWLGYFDQMRAVDVFVIADEMQFSSSGWTHRNRVYGPHGAHWLTLPARPQREMAIVDVPLDASTPWARDHLRTLRHFYGRSPFAADILSTIETTIVPTAVRLIDATLPLLDCLRVACGITTPVVQSSAAGLEQRYRDQFSEEPGPSHRIIAFMKALGATELLEGESGRSYIDVPLFHHHGLRVEFHKYTHPHYAQLRTPFISHLSAIDAWLSVGTDGLRRLLRQSDA